MDTYVVVVDCQLSDQFEAPEESGRNDKEVPRAGIELSLPIRLTKVPLKGPQGTTSGLCESLVATRIRSRWQRRRGRVVRCALVLEKRDGYRQTPC